MEPWIWAIIGGVPVVAVGTAYAMGAFSTNIPAVNQKIAEAQANSTAFTGDDDYQSSAGRRKKTKKSKSKHKKTKRHSK